jgi:hypothetical protein
VPVLNLEREPAIFMGDYSAYSVPGSLSVVSDAFRTGAETMNAFTT